MPGVIPFGAILAGGNNSRYGAPKALVPVGGERIIDRVVRALRGATPDLVLVANRPELFADLALPTRPDLRPGLGALGGLFTALHWAREAGRPGVLAVACDMPFLSPTLLARVADLALDGEADVVVPESDSRRGIEPLCAYYGTQCIASIEAQLERGDRRMVGFHDDVRVLRIPQSDVRRFGSPDLLFMNVNTHEDRERADRLAADA
ncbi:MAG: molybdenum cofactor guanylyltransferase [Gemmatimonadota bacterium]|jgi:molybdopterin-guanine dinucleotide biosynthesis protein A